MNPRLCLSTRTWGKKKKKKHLKERKVDCSESVSFFSTTESEMQNMSSETQQLTAGAHPDPESISPSRSTSF